MLGSPARTAAGGTTASSPSPSKRWAPLASGHDSGRRGRYAALGPHGPSSSSSRRKRLGLFVLGGMLVAVVTMNFLTLHGSTAAVATGGVRQGTAIDGEGGGGWSLWPQELSLGFYVARLRGILHGSSSSSSSSMVEPPPPEAAAPPPPSGATSEAKENTRLRGRGEDKPGKGAAAGPDLGSEVDLDEALRQTKEKIKREQEEKQRREDAAAHEDRQKEEEERLRLEREAAGAAVAPAAPPVPAVEPVEPAADAEQPSSSSSLPTTTTTTTTTTSTTPGVVPLQPAGAKAVRLPITGRPPLHRPLAEVNIQKIVVTISSTDRGQRIADLWQGDKLDTIMATLTALKELCERGFDVTVWFVAAWRVSLEKERLDEASFCQRTQLPLETRYWDEFPEDIGGLLSSRHRLAMAEVLDEYDFFVSIEDDIHLEPSLIDAYLQASSRLAGAVEEEAREHHYVGFARKEHDKKHGEEWSVWETDADDYEALYVDGAGWWGYVTGNTHQAMWMATREQLYNLDDRCQDGFVRLKNPDGASWVEFWSGVLQLYDSPEFCEDLRKVMPFDASGPPFGALSVWHMTDSKLYLRGRGVTPITAIVAKLEADKASRIAQGEGGGEEDVQAQR